MLADLIDKRYAAYPEESSAVAASVLARALIDTCTAQMNANSDALAVSNAFGADPQLPGGRELCRHEPRLPSLGRI
jgi:hypothetical protein